MSIESLESAESAAISPPVITSARSSELGQSLRSHSLLIAIAAVHFVCGDFLVRRFTTGDAAANDWYSMPFLFMTGAAGAVFLIAYAIHLRVVVKPPDYWRNYRGVLFGQFLTWRRFCHVLPVLLLMPAFGAVFTNLKVLIPAVNPFGWDAAFAQWDRMLHGGYDPWQLLHPVLGYPYVTALINGFYNLWFILAYGVFCWQMATLARPRLRMQYLVTFILSWAIIGNAMATLLSSAGPVYYARVTGLEDPFAPLMAYLHQANTAVPVSALHIQDMLWRLYETRGFAIGGGISAMPSLHVAIAFSFVLLARAVDRRLAIAFGVFALLILVGSVHLGWHYAIDGYVSIAATWLIWSGVGWMLERPGVTRLLWGNSGPGKADLRGA